MFDKNTKLMEEIKALVETIITTEDIEEAVQEEREACAELCLLHEGAQLNRSYTDALENCAEAIRQRGKK